MRMVLAVLLIAGCDPFPGATLDAGPQPLPDARVADAAIDTVPLADAALCFQGVDQGLGDCVAEPARADCGDADLRSGGQRLAQTFRPMQSGALTSARVFLANADKRTTHFTVSIVDLGGNPDALRSPKFRADDHVIATVDVAASDEPAWAEAGFATPPHVDADQPYALAVRAVGGTQVASWRAQAGDGYPRGAGYALPNRAPAYVALAGDLQFETRVVPEVCR
jgi:hypothetical protein